MSVVSDNNRIPIIPTRKMRQYHPASHRRYTVISETKAADLYSLLQSEKLQKISQVLSSVIQKSPQFTEFYCLNLPLNLIIIIC